MFMASAAMGSAFAMIVNHFVPGAHLAPGAFALVAMGAVFGAASRATFTFIIFAFELTRDYNSVLPLMLVSVIADSIAMLMLRSSIMTEKLARRGLRIHQDYEADVLQVVSVDEIMDREIPTIYESMSLRALADQIANHDPAVTRHHGLIVTDDQGQLVGILTRGDLTRGLVQDPSGATTVLQVASREPVVAYPDETLHEAANRMLRHGFGRLPVVSRENPKKVVGYLGRSQILAARMRRLEEEHLREPGWIGRFRRQTES
jgi:CBS domain-containing protein